MNWKTKAVLFRLAAALPGGEAIDRLRKRRMAGSVRTAIDLHLTPALKMLARLRDECGFDLAGTRTLEIGAGWNPVYGVLFSILGAQRVTLLDIRAFLTADAVSDVVAGLGSRVDAIAESTGRDESELRAGLDAIDRAAGLAEKLATARIDYRAPADATATGLSAGSIDLVHSTCVLEHIPSDVLPKVHAETARVLSTEGLCYHIVDLSDHFAHGDPSIHRLNFLRHSDGAWRRFGQHRLFYLNRLRAPQIVAQMEGAGLRVLITEKQAEAGDLEFVRSITLPASLAGVSSEDAAVHLMHVAASRV